MIMVTTRNLLRHVIAKAIVYGVTSQTERRKLCSGLMMARNKMKFTFVKRDAMRSVQTRTNNHPDQTLAESINGTLERVFQTKPAHPYISIRCETRH